MDGLFSCEKIKKPPVARHDYYHNRFQKQLIAEQDVEAVSTIKPCI